MNPPLSRLFEVLQSRIQNPLDAQQSLVRGLETRRHLVAQCCNLVAQCRARGLNLTREHQVQQANQADVD